MSDLAPSVASFLERSRTYAQRAGLAPSTVSRKIFNDGKTLDRLASGADIGVNTLATANDKLGALERSLGEGAEA